MGGSRPQGGVEVGQKPLRLPSGWALPRYHQYIARTSLGVGLYTPLGYGVLTIEFRCGS